MNPIELVFGALERGIGRALAVLYTVIPEYGIDIILLTIVIRLLLYPLTARSSRQMRKMQQLQPHMKKLQERYKNDRQLLNEKQMELFRANKVNPVSGCLPMILQMPIFFALFRVINGAQGKKVPAGTINIDFIGKSSALGKALAGSTLANPTSAALFLGVMNLGVSPQQYISQKNWSVLGLIPHLILVVAILFTGWYQQRQTQARSNGHKQEVPQAMQTMTKVMPFVFGWISFLLPSGVNLYFLTSNTFQILQQYFIFRGQGDDDIVVPSGLKDGGRPAGKAKAGDVKAGAATARPSKGKGGDAKVPKKVAPKSKRAEGGTGGPSEARRKRVQPRPNDRGNG